MKTYKFYLNAGKNFIEQSNKTKSEEKEYNQFAATLLFWIALESYVNTLCLSLEKSTRLHPHEKSFLNERELRVSEDGFFQEVSIRPSTTKKLLFLVEYFTKSNIKDFKSKQIWRDVKDFEEMRNKIIHHKEIGDISIRKGQLKKYEETTQEVIKLMNRLIFNKRQ